MTTQTAIKSPKTNLHPQETRKRRLFVLNFYHSTSSGNSNSASPPSPSTISQNNNPPRLLRLVFVWVPQKYIQDLLITMGSKGFVHFQTLDFIYLDFEKAKELALGLQKNKPLKSETEEEEDIWPIVNRIGHVKPSELMFSESSEYFYKSKRTLFVFKKNNTLKFQLRYQSTFDVVFDMPLQLGKKCDQDRKSYVYLMIEALLPDCLVVNQKKNHEFGYKMLELWADKGQYRRGWISVVEQ